MQARTTPYENIKQAKTTNRYCANRKFKQYYRKGNDTNGVVIVYKKKMQAPDQQEVKTTTNTFSTETQHKTDLWQRSKQQTTNKCFICNIIDKEAKTRDPK